MYFKLLIEQCPKYCNYLTIENSGTTNKISYFTILRFYIESELYNILWRIKHVTFSVIMLHNI